MNLAITLRDTYNWSPKHIRLQNDCPKKASWDKGIVDSSTEQYADQYYAICTQMIDWQVQNFPLCKRIFIDNEDPGCYNNEVWWNTYKQVFQYANNNNLEAGVTNYNSVFYDTLIPIYGPKDYVNHENMDVFGCNISCYRW